MHIVNHVLTCAKKCLHYRLELGSLSCYYLVSIGSYRELSGRSRLLLGSYRLYPCGIGAFPCLSLLKSCQYRLNIAAFPGHYLAVVVLTPCHVLEHQISASCNPIFSLKWTFYPAHCRELNSAVCKGAIRSNPAFAL